MNFVYVAGEPATGKSTLLRHYLEEEGFVRRPAEKRGLVRWYKLRSCILIGDYRPQRGDFPGTDGLSMAVAPQLAEFFDWAAHVQPRYHLLAEGDRLASVPIFEAAQYAGYDVELILLQASPATLAERQGERGNQQNPTFLKGRRTKYRRLPERWPDCHVFESDRPNPDAAAFLRSVLR